MKNTLRLTIAALVLVGLNLSAATLHVSLESPNPTPPFSTWETAANVIQDAVDLAMDGDTVLVGDGVYSVGGRETLDEDGFSIGSSARVVVTRPITLLSVNGPEATTIVGSRIPAGADPMSAQRGIRCVYLGNDAVLSGFTLTNGTVARAQGAGVYCETGAVVTNCTLTGNVVAFLSGTGGGASGGSLYNCTLTHNVGNMAEGSVLHDCVLTDGGGVLDSTLYKCTLSRLRTGSMMTAALHCTFYDCTLSDNTGAPDKSPIFSCILYNCTLTGNVGNLGFAGAVQSCDLYNCTVTGNDGIYGGIAYNCIIYGNTNNASAGADPTLNYCLTSPLPTNGIGNIEGDPRFVDPAHGDFRLRPDSPCIDAGTNLIGFNLTVTNEWGEASVFAYNHAPTDFLGNTRFIDGNGDGIVAWDIGAYEFRPSPTTLHVSLESTNPVPPYATWETAANVIQDAVDAAMDGDTVLVTNGVYDIGSREGSWKGLVTESRVVIRNSITLESVNGASATLIVGDQVLNEDGTPTNGIRCVSMGDKAVLRGFTLTKGYSVWGAGAEGGLLYNCTLKDNVAEGCGGGAVYSNLRNCILTGNSVLGENGGGAILSTLHGCTITGNSARVDGGGTDQCTLYDCSLTGNWAFIGGGARLSTLYNCSINGNSASMGGGVVGSTLYDCNLTANSAFHSGGGVWGCILYNCILTGNVAPYGGWATGSGLFNCTVVGNVSSGGVVPSRGEGMQVWNSILYYNTSPNGIDYGSGVSLHYCCTSPLPTNGVGNIAGPPLFMDMAVGDFRLREDSPCIDAGTHLMSPSECSCYGIIIPYSHDPTDILGNTRFIDGNGDGVVAWDIGAYEFNSWKAPRFAVHPQLTGDGWKLNITGARNKWARLQRSSDLVTWEDVWSGFMGAEGAHQCNDGDMGQKAMFYRVVVP